MIGNESRCMTVTCNGESDDQHHIVECTASAVVVVVVVVVHVVALQVMVVTMFGVVGGWRHSWW